MNEQKPDVLAKTVRSKMAFKVFDGMINHSFFAFFHMKFDIIGIVFYENNIANGHLHGGSMIQNQKSIVAFLLVCFHMSGIEVSILEP